MQKKRWITGAELAEETGVSRQRISTLTKKGVLKRNAKNLYDAELCKKTIDDRRDLFQKGKKDSKTYTEIKAEYEKIKIELAMFELKKKRGEFVEVSKVTEEWIDMITTAKKRLLAMPTKIAPLIVGQKSIRKIKSVLDAEIRTVLDDLSKRR